MCREDTRLYGAHTGTPQGRPKTKVGRMGQKTTDVGEEDELIAAGSGPHQWEQLFVCLDGQK